MKLNEMMFDELKKTGSILIDDYVAMGYGRIKISKAVRSLSRQYALAFKQIKDDDDEIVGYEMHFNAPLKTNSGAYTGACKALYSQIEPRLRQNRIMLHELQHIRNQLFVRDVLKKEGYKLNGTGCAWVRPELFAAP